MDKNNLNTRIFTYSDYLKKKFGEKIFRVGLSIGKLCLHRLQTGGCIFCNPQAYTDHYQLQSLSIREQLQQAIPNLYKSCGKVKLLAYFQDETSTACSLTELKEKIDEVLEEKEIVGIILSTRPDYLQPDFIEYFRTLKVPFTIELGLQTIHEKSLKWLQRGHNFLPTKKAIELCGKADLEFGVHLILGIPGETIEDMQETIQFISENPFIKQVKFHNLVAYKNTKLEAYYQRTQLPIYTINQHIETLTQLLPNLRGDIAITRLFTSNIINFQPTVHTYSGNKTKWMNQLRISLQKQGIIQGMNTKIPYNFKALAV
jgi:uncharacterized protein